MKIHSMANFNDHGGGDCNGCSGGVVMMMIIMTSAIYTPVE